MSRRYCVLGLLFVLIPAILFAADGNRLTYLDEPANPYYPHRKFPKLTTPMWVGEEGVECVVVLAIDDMRGHEKWETYLRPILNRLKQIDGRAPVSIMTCTIDPKHPHLQQWLAEGVSLEVHTVDHPCPLLGGLRGEGRGARDGRGNDSPLAPQPSPLALAKSTYDRCVDLMNEIPGNKPVAFRMPCCDSLNTVSPRFFTEIFNKTTPLQELPSPPGGEGSGVRGRGGNFLQIDSSVFNLLTANDPDVPRELALVPDGTERFRRYLPKGLVRNGATFDRFVNYIEDYPYPYVIDRLCWEFPCVVPSDWSAQHLQGPNNPDTVRDLKAALDIVVHKQGVYNLVFHPHGWIKAEQVVELIDHAVAKHGNKVKFLNFREALERLNRNLLAGHPIRSPELTESGVKVLDVNHDRFMDVMIANEELQQTRVWKPDDRSWLTTDFPLPLSSNRYRASQTGAVFGVVAADRNASVFCDRNRCYDGEWHFVGNRWSHEKSLRSMIWRSRSGMVCIVGSGVFDLRNPNEHELLPESARRLFVTSLFQLRDLDSDGCCEVVSLDGPVFRWDQVRQVWSRCEFRFMPSDFASFRFIDLDEDGHDDIVFSNHERYGIWLWESLDKGWSREVLSGKRGEKPADRELPQIVRADGSNNGFFVKDRQLVWQNEDTATLPDLIDRRTFDDLLAQAPKVPASGGREAPGGDKNKKPTDKPRRSDDATGGLTPPARQENVPKRQPGGSAGASPSRDDQPLSPADALKSMRVRPGFAIDLVAAEPLTMDPVAFAWGADGKFWIVEMADYPLGIPDDEPAVGASVTKLPSPSGRGAGGEGASSAPRPATSPHPNPLPKGEGTKRAGRVRYLEDTDGDGQYDKSTLFLDNVPYPNGVLPWRKGVLISAAPDIFYAEDTDGDGKADKRIVLFTGFAPGNQQHRVNGFSYGLDNWVYLANGDSAGGVKVVGSLRDPEFRSRSDRSTIDIRGRDVRIRPDTGEIDTATGQTQFGRNRDDWGNWFGCNNSNPMYHFVLADHYLRRNPHVPSVDPRVNVSVTPGNAPVFPASRTLERFNDFHTANRFTSACSAIVYRDDLFYRAIPPSPSGRGAGGEGASPVTRPPQPLSPDGERGDAAWVFISEPVHNLVHREVMTPKGSTFTSQRAADEQTSEFLASTDNWFRPTMIQTGPDGALYVADMYRHVIEHPEWIPKDWQKRLDLRAGHDKGRIYRVYPTGAKLRGTPRLDKMSATELVAALDSSSGWQRDTAQRLLIERADKSSIPLLEKLAADSTRPLTRLHALCTLDGLHALVPAIVRRGLTDDHSGVRRNAVRLCESLLPSPSGRGAGGEGASSGQQDTNSKSTSNSTATPPHPNPLPEGEGTVARRSLPDELITALLKLTTDPDPQVRLQLACTLGEINDPRAGRAIGELIVNHGSDRYLFAAAMSSIHKANVSDVIAAVLANQKREAGDGSPLTPSPSPPAGARGVNVNLLENLMTLATALGNDAALATLLTNFVKQTDLPPKSRFEVLASLLEMLARQKQSLASLRDGGNAELRTIALKLGDVFATARRVAEDSSQPEADRIAAMRLLGHGLDQQSEDLVRLEKLLAPQSPTELQRAAVESLGNLNQPQVPATLLAAWKGFSPTRRGQVLDVLLSRNEWSDKLLDAVEQKSLAVADIDAARRQRVLGHGETKLRDRAQKLFAGTVNADRKKVVEAMSSALTLTGQIDRGRERFQKTCSQCHKLAGMGHDVGPDLMSLTDKSPESLLVAMLDPNRAVEAKFLGYTAVTKSGKTVTGLISAETGGSITLLAPEGKSEVIPRAELDELVGSNKSTMPEGIEKDLTAQDFSDLIAFVRSAVPLPKRKEFAGNSPAVVKPADDGSFSLTTATCEIYGKTLVLEDQYKNLGYWSSEDDHAVWTIDLPRPGRFTVELDYAVENSAAGDLLLIQAGSEELTFRVAGTATWDNYKQRPIGQVTLPAGRHRVACKPGGKIKSALIDLRGVTLKPTR